MTTPHKVEEATPISTCSSLCSNKHYDDRSTLINNETDISNSGLAKTLEQYVANLHEICLKFIQSQGVSQIKREETDLNNSVKGKGRSKKQNKKIYMLSRSPKDILNNTLIKVLYDKLVEEGQCTLGFLVKLYEEKQKELRRTDGTIYRGKGITTVRGALEANSFFRAVDVKEKEYLLQKWEISDRVLADAFFREQQCSIAGHKKKYKLPIKREKRV